MPTSVILRCHGVNNLLNYLRECQWVQWSYGSRMQRGYSLGSGVNHILLRLYVYIGISRHLHSLWDVTVGRPIYSRSAVIMRSLWR